MGSLCLRSLLAIVMMTLMVSCGGGGGGGGGDTGGGGGTTLADLVVTTFSAPSSGVAGTSITVTGTIRNQGGFEGPAAAVIYLSPSTNVAADGGQIGLAVYSGFLAVGGSWNFSNRINLPTNIANGTYYLSVAAQGDDPSADDNNYWGSPVVFTVTGGTTCSSDAYEADSSAGTAKNIALGDTQQHNHCEATADFMKFSATAGAVYGIVAQELGYMAEPGVSIYGTDGATKLAGTSFPATYSRMTWTAPSSGTYYLKVAPFWGTQSAGANTEYRVSLGNTSQPDLIVDDFWYSGAGMPGGLINVSDSIRNTGFTDAGSFDVSVYLSADTAVTSGDMLVGTRTVSSLAANQATSISWLEYALPMPLSNGTYYLATIVNPSGTNELVTSNNTSTVRSIAITNPTACSFDSFEPDSTFNSAATITVGDPPQAHNHCNDTSDWVKFSAEAGKDYSVRVSRTSGYDSPCAILYGTDGTTPLSGACNSAVDWHANASGTYYVEVIGSVGNANEYTVRLQPQLPDLTQTLTANFPMIAAGGIMDVTDAVSNPGYAAAGPFTVGVYRSTDSTVTTGDTLVALRSVSSLSASSYFWDSNQASYAVSFPKSLATGTYYLAAIADPAGAVTELNEANNTSVPIAVTVSAPSCSWDVYEDDDNPSTASVITVGATQTHNFCDDNIDWVSFTPLVDGAYVADTGANYLELFETDGTTRITPHDTDFSSRLSWIATGGTKYYLKSYSGYGTYSFTVLSCTQDAYEDDDSYGAAKSITIGQTQTRGLCEDGYDWIKFDAVQGSSYTMTLLATTGKVTDFSMDLYDTTGLYRLVYGSLGSGPQKGQLLIQNWTAPSTGTYFIKVDPVWGFGPNLDYTLSLQ
ncbi:MAG: CARDB domain-containing protein [Nitrospirota bacterium]